LAVTFSRGRVVSSCSDIKSQPQIISRHQLTHHHSRLVVNLSRHTILADRASDLAADATALVHWMKSAPPSLERDAIRYSYTQTLQSLYIMVAVVSAVATIASFWVEYYDLDQAHDTDHGLQENCGASIASSKNMEVRVERGESVSMSMKRSKSIRREAKLL
jgi:hypothetical protein